MQDERLEILGRGSFRWGRGCRGGDLCEEQRLPGRGGGQHAASWGEPSLLRKQQEIQPWSLLKAF